MQSQGPSDLSLRGEWGSVNVETAVILRDERSRESHDRVESLFRRIHNLEFLYSVTCEGDVQDELDENAAEALLKEIEAAAQTLGKADKRFVESPAARVAVSRDELASKSGLRGPRVESQPWPRTERVLHRKAEQTRGLEKVWLRIDSLDGMWQFTPWARVALSEKLEILSHAIRTALGGYSHVAGVVINKWSCVRSGGILG